MPVRKILCLSLGAEGKIVEDHLRRAGWDVACCSDVSSARSLLAQRKFAVALVVADAAQRLDEAGVAAMEACVHASLQTEWVALCEQAVLESHAFRALILNCFFDYQVLPLEWPDLDRMLEHAAQRAMLRRGAADTSPDADTLGMVGQAASMVQLRKDIRKVAGAFAPVLIHGESGSGKELAAHAIHACSPRKGGPWVEVNCGAIAPSLIQSELFGYVKGAFTGASADRRGLIEAADGGTIFLDEIGDLPLELQANLLRFLQEKTIQRVGAVRSTAVDVRVVAASHVNLAEAVARGRFREDLFYRLNVLTIEVPPLRQRMDDVPLLAKHFLKVCAADRPRRVEGFDRQALAAMAAYSWPGNVRELYNCVQRAVVMTDQRYISARDLGLAPADAVASTDLDAARTLAEREAIARALTLVGNNVTRAARELGVSRMTLYRLMDKHRISAEAS
jgi:DNA-binding NtrC family response regulator